jgi:two-component system, OmpR family, response regulator ChvI
VLGGIEPGLCMQIFSYRRFIHSINTGDILIYHFPKTSGSANISDFKTILECGLTMIDSSKSNPLINAKLQEELLLSLYYRISADYGRVEIANSTIEDLFRPTLTSVQR